MIARPKFKPDEILRGALSATDTILTPGGQRARRCSSPGLTVRVRRRVEPSLRGPVDVEKNVFGAGGRSTSVTSWRHALGWTALRQKKLQVHERRTPASQRRRRLAYQHCVAPSCGGGCCGYCSILCRRHLPVKFLVSENIEAIVRILQLSCLQAEKQVVLV